jgi:hypothetical protein
MLHSGTRACHTYEEGQGISYMRDNFTDSWVFFSSSLSTCLSVTWILKGIIAPGGAATNLISTAFVICGHMSILPEHHLIYHDLPCLDSGAHARAK